MTKFEIFTNGPNGLKFKNSHNIWPNFMKNALLLRVKFNLTTAVILNFIRRLYLWHGFQVQ